MGGRHGRGGAERIAETSVADGRTIHYQMDTACVTMHPAQYGQGTLGSRNRGASRATGSDLSLERR